MTKTKFRPFLKNNFLSLFFFLLSLPLSSFSGKVTGITQWFSFSVSVVHGSKMNKNLFLMGATIIRIQLSGVNG